MGYDHMMLDQGSLHCHLNKITLKCKGLYQLDIPVRVAPYEHIRDFVHSVVEGVVSVKSLCYSNSLHSRSADPYLLVPFML